MVQDINCKERLYNLIAGTGIKILQAVFPEYFAKEPLRPTDRYIEYPFVLSNLPKEPVKILDVGCSGSMFPLLMQAIGHNVSGIDIRRSNVSGFQFFQRDICDTHFVENQFDVITAVSTIEHIGLKGRYGSQENSTDKKALEEIYRILKPEGLFLMTVPFGARYEKHKNHRIYNLITLKSLLNNFSVTYETVASPEANYDIILIKATK